MRVAVLMSTFNGQMYLKEQIDSILSQEGEFSLSLIVRDDGSTDDTKKTLNEYQSKSLLKGYTGENKGASKSFLSMINDNSGYDYYAFSDQDDVWLPDKIRTGIEFLERNGDKCTPKIWVSNSKVVDKDLNYLGRMEYKNKPYTDYCSVLCGCSLQGCAMVFNDMLAKYIRMYDAPEKMGYHDSYIAKVCTAVGGKIFFDRTPFSLYRQHGNNVIGGKKGIKSTILHRYKLVFNKTDVSISDIASIILDRYQDYMDDAVRKFYLNVQNYRKHFYSRVKLALSMKTHYININWNITFRLGIILGNR